MAVIEFIAGLLGNVCVGVIGNRADNAVEALRQHWRERAREGKLPQNHDLEKAVTTAYLQATKMAVEASLELHKAIPKADRSPQANEDIDWLERCLRLLEGEFKKASSSWIPNEDLEDVQQIFSNQKEDTLVGQLTRSVITSLARHVSEPVPTMLVRKMNNDVQTETMPVSWFKAFKGFFLEIYKNKPEIKNIFDKQILDELLVLGVANQEEIRDINNNLTTMQNVILARIEELRSLLCERFQNLQDAHLPTLALIPKIAERQEKAILLLEEISKKIEEEGNKTRQHVTDEINRAIGFEIYPKAKRVSGHKNAATLDRFTDREVQRNDLKQLVWQNQHKLVQICGPSGVGKTTLVTKLFDELEANGTIAAFVYVSQESLRTLGIESILNSLAETLTPEKRHIWEQQRRDNQANPARQSDLLLGHLSGRRTLLFIDNFESLLDESNIIINYSVASFVYTLLTSAVNTSMTLFVTSQRAIKFPDDIAGQINGRICEYPPQHGLQGLFEDDALSLLYKLDHDKSQGIHTIPGDKLRELIRHCGANPRVLETIVGYLQNMGDLYNLSDLLVDEQTLTNILQNPAKALYDSQPEELKPLLQALAIYNKFVPVQAISTSLDQDDIQLRKGLSRLERNFALLYDKRNKTCGLRSTDQQYIYKQINPKIKSVLHRKAVSYYHKLRQPKENWRRVEDLQPQLDEFEHLVKLSDYDNACRVLLEIDYDYLILWGHIAQTRDLHLQLEGKLTETELEIDHLRELGNAYRYLGEAQKAASNFKKGLRLARGINDEVREAVNLSSLGFVYWDLKNLQNAVQHFEVALKIVLKINDKKRESTILGGLGNVYYNLNNLPTSTDYFNKALTIARDIGDKRNEATFLGNLGAIHFRNFKKRLCDAQTVIDCFRQALALALEIGSQSSIAFQLWNLGMVFNHLRDVEKTITLYVAAYSLYNTLQSPKAKNVISSFREASLHITGFKQLLFSLHSEGDKILTEATAQTFTFFQNASPALYGQILQAISSRTQLP